MKILFIKAGNENLGSHRIYFNNLTFFLKKYFPNDFEIEISKDFKENFDIYILSKSITFKQIFEFRKKTKAKIGIISPSDSSFDGKKKIEVFAVVPVTAKATLGKEIIAKIKILSKISSLKSL